jgi:hypothetical protein
MTEQGANKKGKKAPPANLVIPPKKPKLTKAERRALQEQQRAAKVAGNGDARQTGGGGQQNEQKHSSSEVLESTSPKARQNQKTSNSEKARVDNNQVDLFSHLPNFHGKTRRRQESFFSLFFQNFTQNSFVSMF